MHHDSSMPIGLMNIATILVSPVMAAGTALWVFRHQHREKLAASVGWTKINRYGIEDVACLYVQNRSATPLAVIKLDYRFGFLARIKSESTALYYDDPDDIVFPYEIQPGAIRSLLLDERQATKIASDAGPLAHLASRFGRPRFWVIAAMEGAGVTDPASRIWISYVPLRQA